MTSFYLRCTVYIDSELVFSLMTYITNTSIFPVILSNRCFCGTFSQLTPYGRLTTGSVVRTAPTLAPVEPKVDVVWNGNMPFFLTLIISGMFDT